MNPAASVRPWQAPVARNSQRNAAVAGVVLLAHAAALWALQRNPLQRPADLVIPVRLVANLVAPPAPVATALLPEPPAPEPPIRTLPEPAAVPPKPEPQPPAPRAKPTPAKKRVKQPKPAPAPEPAVPRKEPTPAPQASVKPTVKPAVAATPTAAPVAAVRVDTPAAPPPAPVVVKPSTSAAYLNNPAPVYPPLSRRLGEAGRVVVRLLVGTDGRAAQAHIERSSGFPRLDQVALETARDRWRYAPGTRDGLPEAMWVMVPIHFVLE